MDIWMPMSWMSYYYHKTVSQVKFHTLLCLILWEVEWNAPGEKLLGFLKIGGGGGISRSVHSLIIIKWTNELEGFFPKFPIWPSLPFPSLPKSRHKRVRCLAKEEAHLIHCRIMHKVTDSPKKFTKQLIMILPKHLNSVNANIRGGKH